MASGPAVQYNERSAKAIAAMEKIGVSRQVITPLLKRLLKVYNNIWEFIEADNYRLLADNYFQHQEDQNSSRGPLTRARKALSGSDAAENSEEGFHSPARVPDRAKPFPETPSSARAAIHGGRAESDTLSPAKVPNSQGSGHPDDAVPVHVARGMEYHSGASVLSRAEGLSQRNSQGTRGRPVDHNSAGAAAHEKGKGQSSLVKGGDDRRIIEFQQPPSPASKGEQGPHELVTVKAEVCSSMPAPEGIEKVAFEKVGGVIIPAVRRPQNGEVAPLDQSQQLAPLAKRVKLEDEALDQQNNVGTEICAPVPILAVDPGTLIDVKAEPQDDDTCEIHKEELSLNHGVDHEVDLEVNVQASPGNFQIVPYGTSDLVNGIPAADHPSMTTSGPSSECTPEVDSEEHSGLQVDLPPENKLHEDGGSALLPLVDYESEEESLEPVPHGTPGTHTDILSMPDETSELLDPPGMHGQGIRPNFILTSTVKREMTEAEDVVHPKRQKCDSDISTPAPCPAHTQRKIVVDSPQTAPVNGDGGCTPSETSLTGPVSTVGVKRKLIVSASPSSQGSRGASKDKNLITTRAMVRNGTVREAPPSHSEVVAPEVGSQQLLTSALKRVKIEPGAEEQLPKHNPADITRGTERVRIPFVNEFTSETVTNRFSYIPSNVVYQQAYINISLARIGEEDCCLDCTGDCSKAPHCCPCTRETGGEFAYTQQGLLKPMYIRYELDMNQDPEFKRKCMTFCHRDWDCPIERAKNDLEPDKCKGHYVRKFVKECWHKCGCSMQCGNRVVQRGIRRQLQVFFTNNGKGWGIRTAEDLPAGAFVCEYVGEIMTNMELDQRNQDAKKSNARSQAGGKKDTYPVLLDGDWCSERGLKDEEALCLDATKYGNVARFINHRCFDANLIDIPVTIECLDRHYYHIAFFTSRDVAAWEELTWDYKIDFEDEDHPIEAFQCLCKSELCRGGTAPGGKKKHKK